MKARILEHTSVKFQVKITCEVGANTLSSVTFTATLKVDGTIGMTGSKSLDAKYPREQAVAEAWKLAKVHFAQAVETKSEPTNEREKQNAFLNQYGYSWKKEWADEDDADYDERRPDAPVWRLRGHGRIYSPDQLESLLTSLGYYGEAKKAEQVKKAEQAEKVKQAKADLGTFFAVSPAETPARVEPFAETIHFPSQGFDALGGGTEYAIEPDGIWVIANHGSDGDDWSRNNYATGGAGAIARRYPYNQHVALLMREVMLDN